MRVQPDRQQCSYCKERKPLEGFYPSDLQSGKRTCRVCRDRNNRNSFNRRYPEQRGRYLAINARSRAKAKKLPYDLDEHLDAINARAKGVCELTGIPFRTQSGPVTWDSPSIDRIKPELGYVYSNIRFVLHAVNMALGNWGEGVFETIAKAYVGRNFQ